MSAPITEEHPKLDAEVAKPTPELTTTSSATDATADTPPAAATPAVDAPAPVEPPAESAVAPAPTEQPAAPPRERELVQDARLGVLRGMFPDFDDSLLQSVLDSVQGDTDQAINALLSMSDPDYHADPTPPQARPQTQEELDEQLARTLMLEDERSHHAWRAQQQQEPQQRRPEPRRQGSSGAPEKDTMQEFQEQFNKFAETGKKTLGTLFSKVKAKIQEFDQPVAPSQSSSSEDTYAYDAHQSARYDAHQQAQSRAQAQAQTPAYYDPNATAGDSASNSPPASVSAGYDVGAPAPPSTNSGRPQIDGGKLGMLPKRPVSLLGTNPPPAATGAGGGAPPSSDDDDLEYAENPFEEHGRK
ncbi:hypothetical protein B0H14DRAFT_2853225 [Mycena olivaceomarginata]|nr:hypothetical protein B0H14DRAFT_2853225 [Mycena olivaceomarginata]